MKYLKRILALLTALWLLTGLTGALAAAQTEERVFDSATLFTAAQANEIRTAITAFQKATGMDFVVVTSDASHGDTSQQKVADDFYDKYGFGLDSDHSGMLYYIDMYERQNYISTTGAMIDYMTDERIQRALDVTSPLLTSRRYADAVQGLLTTVQSFIKAGIPEGQYRYDVVTGQRLTARHKALTTTELLVGAVLCAVIGFAFVMVVHGRYKLRGSTYHYDYATNANVDMKESHDDYLRTTVTRTRKAPPPSSGGFGGGVGGSGVHMGGGGTSHGGGGRGF